MLDEYKIIYLEKANIIKDWEKLSKTKLCNMYIENKKTNTYLAECYLSAIICKYWNTLNKLCSKYKDLVPPERCYDWLIETILYTLEHHRWLDEDSSIYNDPNGPDKAINRKLKCVKGNYFQASNRYKRKLNHNCKSIDALEEDFSDHLSFDSITCSNDINVVSSIHLTDVIIKSFNDKDYLMAFLIDIILNCNVFSYEDIDNTLYSKFNIKKLIKYIHHMNTEYFNQFSLIYDIPIEKVIKGASYCTRQSTEILVEKIKEKLEFLRRFYFSSVQGVR